MGQRRHRRRLPRGTPRESAALERRLCLAAALPLALGSVAGCDREPPPSPAFAARSTPPARPEKGLETAQAAGPGGIADEALERGLDHVNKSGTAEKALILEANGAGACVLDLGGDGDLDVVFAQGLGSLEELLAGPGADLEVYENDGTGRFTPVAGPGLSGWWTGLAAGDIDGDGDTDLVAGGFGALAVLLQDERGRLVPAPVPSLLPPPERLVPGEPRAPGRAPAWVTSLALFDADRDGNLDLYVGRYLDLDPLAPPRGALGEGALAVPCRWKGREVFCGPHGLAPQADRLLRGLGTGAFLDRTAEWLPGEAAGYTLGVAAFDADGDGDTDLYVACDSTPNRLWINDGRGRFAEHGYAAGVALSADGAAEAGMGIAVGDVDRDGLLDLAVTNFSGEPTQLYCGAPVGFAVRTHVYGLMRETRHLLSWGAHLADLDGDGWLELFTANGHVYPQADGEGTGTSYGQRDTLWRFGPDRRLERVEPEGERSILWPRSGTRGSALGDLDGDGAPDLVLSRIDGPAALGINRTGGGNQRLALRLLGPRRGEPVTGLASGRTPADGMGARAVLVPEPAPGEDEHALLSEVQTSAGYQSASSPWLHFGLGRSERYRTLRILWPSGRVEELGPGRAGRRLVVREGRGIVAEEALP